MKEPISRKLSWLVAILFLPAMPALAEISSLTDVDPLLDMSLEQLMNIEVTSVLKTATRLSDTPGAIYVLTNDDIHRIGATTIPEALRMVPGMHVARIDANKWAVTARGFNGQFANKLLVLVDGRSVYTPLDSGVWWDQQDVIMDDIERIEVIRGPGASLWGANAVNGVINITTKSAKNNQGGLLSAHAGDERGGVGLRYGAKIGDDAYLKIFGTTTMHSGENIIESDVAAGDLSRLHKGGFRFEKEISSDDNLTIQGEIFSGDSGGAMQPFPLLSANLTPVLAPPYMNEVATSQAFNGYNLLGRWEHKISKASDTSLQVYWDNHERDLKYIGAINRVDTLDIDFQHNLLLSEQQHVVWGLGYRRNMEDTTSGNILTFTDSQRSDDLYSLFMQDDITVVPQRWKLTLGSRFEHNSSTGFEVQPNARLLWTPNQHQSVWASISRAVRTPSWYEENLSFSLMTIPPFGGGPASPFNPAIHVGIKGDSKLKSEKLTAYELGWRGTIQPRLAADVALYYYDYKNAETVMPNALDMSNIGSGYLLQTTQFSNLGKTRTYGGEVSVDWQVMDDWKLRASYSHFESDSKMVASAPANTNNPFEGSYPRHQATLWSQHRLTPEINLDLNLRYVGGVNDIISPTSDYTALDARLAWAPQRNLELSLVGRNLLDGGHPEFGSNYFFTATELPRELFVTARYHF